MQLLINQLVFVINCAEITQWFVEFTDVSIFFCRFYHADICSRAHFSDRLGLNYIFDAINRGCDVMIDS